MSRNIQVLVHNFAFNNPIMFVDEDGNDGRIKVEKTNNGATQITLESTVFLYGKDATETVFKEANKQAAALAVPREFTIEGQVYGGYQSYI